MNIASNIEISGYGLFFLVNVVIHEINIQRTIFVRRECYE